ncbi:MAG: GTPase domain-containing protein [Phycisphaerae bacterium]|nr:GTPase domain-containing protein [Phycisphaerae bacterium]
MTSGTLPSLSQSPLAGLNREFARLFKTEPLSLELGADRNLQDELVICGVMGGKDVGKSTLINALARERIAVDRQEVGRGTHRPLAYVHREREVAVRNRLSGIASDLEVAPHTADEIRDLVLVDLPDFDSDFLDHLTVVRRIVPALDRVIWVQTPRKIGDRAWVSMFRDSVKDPANVLHVLNKTDELLADAFPAAASTNPTARDSAAAFWESQRQWFRETLQNVVEPVPDERLFLVAAVCPDARCFAGRIAQRWGDPTWEKFNGDRAMVEGIAARAEANLDRLRSAVLSPLDELRVRQLKESNRSQEHAVWCDRMRRHFDVDETLERLRAATDGQYWQSAVEQSLAGDLYESLVVRTASRFRRDTQLADELLEQQVDRWPLLRLVYWPLGWLSRTVGRQLAPSSGPSTTQSLQNDETVVTRIRMRADMLRSGVLAEHNAVIERLGLGDEIPQAESLAGSLVDALDRSATTLEEELLEQVGSRRKRGNLFGRLGLLFILLWFPIIQPVAAGLLEIAGEEGAWHTTRGLYRVVSALSATHLLAGFGVVAGVYLAILSIMHARCLRRIRRVLAPSGGSVLAERAVDMSIAEAWVTPLRRPFVEQLRRLEALERRLANGEPSGQKKRERQ